MKKKINWALSIIIFLSAIAFIKNSWQQVDELTFEYGKGYNSKREALGIPLIEDHWILHDHNAEGAEWMNPEHRLMTIEPTHFYKIITLKSGKIISEEDAFHYKGNDTISYRIVSTYSYLDSITARRLITYYHDSYPPSSSIDLSIAESDSILSKWKLINTLQQEL